MISARVVARAAVVAAMVLLAAGTVQSAGITIDTVPVGNTGNTGELSGGSVPGGHGTDRICGAVDYEYNIGKYEVTAGQYTTFLAAVAKTDTYGLYNTNMADPYTEYVWGCNIQRTDTGSGYSYSVASDWANRPVNYVSWGDAARFANWLTNGQPTADQGPTTTEDGSYYLNGAISDAALMAVTRIAEGAMTSGEKYYCIPTEDEWYKAAYHKNDGDTGNYFDYPTSSNTAPGQDMTDVSGNNANYYTAPYAYPIDSGKYTTVAGEFQNSESPYGTFDQGGNILEWNEAIIAGSYRGLRGGSFGLNYSVLLAANRYFNGSPTYEDLSYGFRVSAVPEPATMGLLALGGLGMLARRRSVRG